MRASYALGLTGAGFAAVAVQTWAGGGFVGGALALLTFTVGACLAEVVAGAVEAGRQRRAVERSRAATAEWLAGRRGQAPRSRPRPGPRFQGGYDGGMWDLFRFVVKLHLAAFWLALMLGLIYVAGAAVVLAVLWLAGQL